MRMYAKCVTNIVFTVGILFYFFSSFPVGYQSSTPCVFFVVVVVVWNVLLSRLPVSSGVKHNYAVVYTITDRNQTEQPPSKNDRESEGKGKEEETDRETRLTKRKSMKKRSRIRSWQYRNSIPEKRG